MGRVENDSSSWPANTTTTHPIKYKAGSSATSATDTKRGTDKVAPTKSETVAITQEADKLQSTLEKQFCNVCDFQFSCMEVSICFFEYLF